MPAQLVAAGFLPSVWTAGRVQSLRRQVARRAHIVQQRARLKNRVQSILDRNLLPRCPAADLFGHKGRAWLAEQDLPLDERQPVVAGERLRHRLRLRRPGGVVECGPEACLHLAVVSLRQLREQVPELVHRARQRRPRRMRSRAKSTQSS
jgi:hypothetical protein